MNIRLFHPAARSLLAAAFAFILAGNAAAQTIVQTAPPDPLVISLRDQIDRLEQQVRTLTGENERLQFEAARAKEETVRLNRTIDDMNTQANIAALGVPAAPQAAGALGDIPASAIASAPAGSATDAYAQAYGLIARGDAKAGEEALVAFLINYPNDAKAPDAHYWIGQSLLVQNKPADAANRFLGIAQKTPKAAIAPQAMVRLGVALNRMGEKAQACATLKAVPAQYPAAAKSVKDSAAAQMKAIGC